MLQVSKSESCKGSESERRDEIRYRVILFLSLQFVKRKTAASGECEDRLLKMSIVTRRARNNET
ncbi:hypothetical protein E2C01_036835 [Portunus trituberculatus]|uniref:Uncharacterized protein n=1 Tax=Portunus trituberculatus TaxID=210409 RepID=A0A5B7FCG0_PORTR|nr:hypothetical protein [Portunus trituberculatus]